MGRFGRMAALALVAVPVALIGMAWLSVSDGLLLGLVAAFAALVIGGWLELDLGLRLEELRSILKAFATGQFEGRALFERKGPLGDLADQVNRTARALEAIETRGEVAVDRLRTILDSLNDGVVDVAEGRRVVSMNPAAERILEVSAAEAVGRPLIEVVTDPELDDQVRRCLEHGTGGEFERDRGAGQGRVRRYWLAPLATPSGSGLLLVVRDITHERRLERVRQDFIINATHELQTPLTSIRGFAETLAGPAGEDPATRQRFAAVIASEAQRLSRLVADLLDLSRWEGTRPPIEPKPVDFLAVVREITEVFRPAIAEHGLKFQLILSDRPVEVWADRQALQRVVQNLMENALKYTPEGQITVRVFQRVHDARLEVEDTGLGIPPQDLPRVFERFYRVEKARDRQSGGTGLGLAIVRHLTQAHGGRVRATSPGRGQGSLFTVDWPLASTEENALTEEQTARHDQQNSRTQLGLEADPVAERSAEDEAESR